MAIKTTIWEQNKVTIFVGGNPEKNEPPYITIELNKPQIQLDSTKNTIFIFETK